MLYQWIRANKLSIMKIASFLTMVISISVMFGWIYGHKELLRIVEGGPTMKFNTALLFFCSGLTLLFISFERIRNRYYVILPLSLLILLISGLTIFGYIFNDYDFIDSLLVKDEYSVSSQARMSLATAISFFVLGISFWLVSSERLLHKEIGQFILAITLAFGILSAVTFALQVSIENKFEFMDTMAIHTSALFIILALTTALRNHEIGFSGLILGTSVGSRMLQNILPLILLFPLALSLGLQNLNRLNQIQADFGLALYTIILISAGLIFMLFYARRLNRSENIKTKLEKSSQALNQELLDYKLAMDKVSLVTITDSSGNITHVNDLLCETSGYTREELIGTKYQIIDTNNHSKSFFKELWATIRNGEMWRGEVLNRSKTGKRFWFNLFIIPFKSADQKIYQYLWLAQDISVIKKAEIMNDEYVKELKEKNNDLLQFAYITSHDLQEPLRTLTNYSSLFTSKYAEKLDAEGLTQLKFINDASLRMRDLIRDILDYSRIGKILDKEPINTQEIVTSVLDDMAALIEQHHVQFHIEALPEIIGYKTQIRLLFQNLINNAIKFKSPDRKPEVTIGQRLNSNYWEFYVADNGIGIDPQYQEKIFLIFQRLHKTSKYKGTGIGLAHCHKSVQMHGGKIWFESNINPGTTFYFTIKKT